MQLFNHELLPHPMVAMRWAANREPVYSIWLLVRPEGTRFSVTEKRRSAILASRLRDGRGQTRNIHLVVLAYS